jgi:hypothetical protein
MPQKFFGVTAFHKGNAQASYRNLLERGVQASVAVNLVEIGNGNIVAGAFVFNQIPFFKYSGDVLFYKGIISFLMTTQSICKGSAVSWNSE